MNSSRSTGMSRAQEELWIDQVRRIRKEDQASMMAKLRDHMQITEESAIKAELELEKRSRELSSTFVKHDVGKTQYDLLPPAVLKEVADVLTYGANKYSPNNWMKCESPSRYYSAAYRHIEAHRSGEKKDPESNLNHLAHAICCLMFVYELDKDK